MTAQLLSEMADESPEEGKPQVVDSTTPAVSTSTDEHADVSSADADKLAEYDELFKHRYTMEDSGYAASVTQPPEPPVIVDPWRSKPFRNFDYTRREPQKRQYDDRNEGRPYHPDEFADSKRRRYDNSDRGRQGGYEPYGRSSHHHRGGRGDFNHPYRNRREVGSRGYNDDTSNKQPRSSYSGSHRN